MNVVDSSGWLAYFADARNASRFARQLRATDSLVVPAISVYEVYKVLLREAGEDAALQGVAAMRRGHVVDLDVQLSVLAATLSLEHTLPMADSIILATARTHNATLWTQDADFEGIDGVRYIAKS